jgi:uncharacterized membrane protein
VTRTPRPGFRADFRKFFGRGLAILLPTVLTLWLLWQAVLFVFATVAEPINRGIRLGTMRVMPSLFAPETGPREWYHIQEPAWWHVDRAAVGLYQAGREERGLLPVAEATAVRDIRRERFRELWGQHWYLEGTGLVVAIVLIYFAGLIVTNYLGRKLYHVFERALSKMPGFKQVYPHVKQVVEMVMGDTRIAFKRVVMVQYPRQGAWTLGFVTNSGFREVRRGTGVDPMLTVFIPSTPTPFTGFIINVPAGDVVDMNLTIDQALRFVITGGMLTPDDKVPPRDGAASIGQASGALAGRAEPESDGPGAEATPCAPGAPPAPPDDKGGSPPR